MLNSIRSTPHTTIAHLILIAALVVFVAPGAALADDGVPSSSDSPPVLLAQLEVPAGSTPPSNVDEGEVEDAEDTGNWDTPPDSTSEWQPLDQRRDPKNGIILPSDSTAVSPTGITLPPLGGAPSDTLQPVGATRAPTPAPTGAIGPKRPASTTPTERNGVLGISPIAIVAGLAVLHVFIVRAATN